MDLSQSQTKTKIAIAAVHGYSHAYPNSYFKVQLLLKHFGDSVVFVNTGAVTERLSDRRSTRYKILTLLQFLTSNIRCCWQVSRLKVEKLYVCYPGIILLLLLTLIPRRSRPVVYLDAFISIYDTLIHDRKMLSEGNPLAKLVHVVERFAFKHSEKVITDTAVNCEYYAKLFDLPSEKFTAVTLTGEEFKASANILPKNEIRCLFVGTFVPLQGVTVIAKAAELLKHRNDIRFDIVGDGQESESLLQAIETGALHNLTWEASWQGSKSIQNYLDKAAICLGIFGASEKADRVWPYKNYLYMSAGKPLITGNSSQSRLIEENIEQPFISVERGNPEALARAIEALADDPIKRKSLSVNARKCYEQTLSHDRALTELVQLLHAEGQTT